MPRILWGWAHQHVQKLLVSKHMQVSNQLIVIVITNTSIGYASYSKIFITKRGCDFFAITGHFHVQNKINLWDKPFLSTGIGVTRFYVKLDSFPLGNRIIKTFFEEQAII